MTPWQIDPLAKFHDRSAFSCGKQTLDIIRACRKLGLSQAELARRAGIRPETLNRIEQGKRSASVATVDKIDRALRKAEGEARE